VPHSIRVKSGTYGRTLGKSQPRRGQYHKKYRDLAEEVCLTSADAGTRGWDETRMRESTEDGDGPDLRQFGPRDSRERARRRQRDGYANGTGEPRQAC